MEKQVYIFNLIKSYGLLFLIIFIITAYYVIVNYKKTEGFELFQDNCSTITCDNIKNKTLLISGDYSSYYSIYDKFYSFIYDDISFNKNVYEEQALLIKSLLEPYNLHVQNLLINDIMTGHLYGTIHNFPCHIHSTNSTPDLVKKCKKNYPQLDNNYINMLQSDNYYDHNHRFTCITNFSNKIYYYNKSEIQHYFNNVSNLLNSKGFFVISYINNFDNIKQLYGLFNTTKNTYLRMNYVYKINVENSDNLIKFNETIYPKSNKNKIRKNYHKLYKYNQDHLNYFAKKNNLELVHNTFSSKYKKHFGFLIYQKMM